MNDSNGLIETNDANFGIAGNGYVNPLYGLAFSYGDCCAQCQYSLSAGRDE